MNFKYCVQLPPDLRWSEWRDIEPIPEKHILSIQYDKLYLGKKAMPQYEY